MNHQKFRLTSILFYAVIYIYVGTVCGILLTVILSSVSKGWFSGIIPKIYTFEWYKYVAQHHDLISLLRVTLVVVIAAVFFSLLIAYPASYALAKKDFKFKNTLLLMLILPAIVPPMTYGLPLAIVLYRLRLAPHLSGVIIANMVPTIGFMILVLVPFFEQVGENIESAARMLGANKLRIFSKILIPLTLPGILTATVLSVVRTISMFDLTFLVAGARTQTLVVALFTDVYLPGGRPYTAIDALAVIFFVLTMVIFLISLKFVSPTQMIFKIK
jgi:putative spermidine/putrescine transport system permease protein